MWHCWGVVSWLWVCVEVAEDRICKLELFLTPPHPPHPPPNVQGIFPSLTRILCLTSNSWCRLAVYIWDGTKLIRFAKSASSMANIVLYSRSLQRQKGTILFALLGWPPCLWPWKQDSSSPGQDLLWKHGLSWFADRVSVHSGAWIE